MAKSKNTTVAPGVTREDWGHCWILSGNMDALIASGIAKEEWFPTWLETERRGRVKRTNKLNVDERRIEVRRPPIGRCEVRFYRTRTERAEYEEAHREEWEREDERIREIQREGLLAYTHDREIQRYADTLSIPGGLKAEIRSTFEIHLKMVGRVFGLSNNMHVYWGVPREVRERADELLFQLKDLFEQSEMTPTREVKARADAKFQSFIKTLLPSD
jgi:hypothetical protein